MPSGDFDVTTVITALASQLSSNISGLRTYATTPFTVDPPAVVFHIEEILYDQAMSNSAHDLVLLAIVCTQFGSDRGELQLRKFMAPTGTNSVSAAVDSDWTLGGNVAWSNVKRMRQVQILTLGEAQFYSASFEIEIGTGK